MPDYNKGKVYTIRCRTDDTLIYIGSTTQPLAVRWGEHKRDSNKEKCQNRLIYKTINGNWNDWYIELHSLYPCENKEQLNKREGEITRAIGTLNTTIAGRTLKEYKQDYREEILEEAKQYYINNKEKRKEYMEKYREEHREEISAKDREYYNIKRRENYAKRQAKKKDIESLNPV